MLWNRLAILYQWKSVCLNKNNPTQKQSKTAPLDSRPLPSFHLLRNLPLSSTSLCSSCLFSFLQLLSCLAVSWTNARQWGSLTREQPGSTDKWARLCKEKGKEKRNKDCQHCHWKKKRALTSEQPSQLPGQMSSALQRERKKEWKIWGARTREAVKHKRISSIFLPLSLPCRQNLSDKCSLTHCGDHRH